MDGKAIDLRVFAVALFRLHHKAPARKLAQHASLAVLGVQHQHLGLGSNVYPLKPEALCSALLIPRPLHPMLSVNTLTGSISTGTSFTFARADFNSGGIESYFLNHCSARFRSPVASISSSSFAKVAIACDIFVKSIAYFPVGGSRIMAPCSAI